uniref:Uncharacterized protein n=1 Tax=Anguilla anguilla TaxID=7936 RepID=A0A0E9V8A6_ANGAN
MRKGRHVTKECFILRVVHLFLLDNG